MSGRLRVEAIETKRPPGGRRLPAAEDETVET
jgi:hypothetical protein